MCESKAVGGHRCKTHLEQERVAIDNKIHESIMREIPESERPDMSTWKPSALEGETIMMVSLQNPTVEASQQNVNTVRSAAVAKQSRYEAMLLAREYDKFLKTTNSEYKKADDAGKKKIVDDLESELSKKGNVEVAFSAMGSDWKKVDEAHDAYRDSFQAVTAQTSKAMFYQSNPAYQKAREDFNYTPEGAKLNRERSMVSVNGEIMNKTERKNLDKRIAEEKNPLEKEKLNIELHRQQYLSDASTVGNQVSAYKGRSTQLKDGERVVIGGQEQWPATTIISMDEGKRIVADEFAKGNVSSTVKPAIVLAKKGLYVEGSLAAKSQVSRIEREAKNTLDTRAEKLEESLWV